MYKYVLLIILFPLSLSAQNPDKAERMVYNLMDSGILKQYKDYRSDTELYVALFKAKQTEYSVEDMIRLKSSYERTAEAYEDFIYSIRNDLLDRKKRKEIRKDCDSYIHMQLTKLNKVYADYYIGRFQPTYTAIADPENAVALGRRVVLPEISAALIATVSKATLDLITFLDEKNERDLQELKQVLNDEWVQPNRFRSWDQI